MKNINKARDFAIIAHGDQLYGKHPYKVHLDAVATIASNYGDTATIIAYLHDVVEDTDTTLDEIEKYFGQLVSKSVEILTDEAGESRKERKLKTYRKMAKVSGETEIALVVKVCDRMANVTACIDDTNTRLLKLYTEEHSAFTNAVYRTGLCDELWRDLDLLINSQNNRS